MCCKKNNNLNYIYSGDKECNEITENDSTFTFYFF